MAVSVSAGVGYGTTRTSGLVNGIINSRYQHQHQLVILKAKAGGTSQFSQKRNSGKGVFVVRSQKGGLSDHVAVINGNYKTEVLKSGSLEDELARVLASLRKREGKDRGAVRVAYQGCPGAYSEAAAIMAHPGCEGVPCRSYEDAIWAVESRRADRAILPVESTLEGSVVRNYDLLVHHSLHIVQEIQLFVHYCLLVVPGVSKGDVRRVISHPMALAHCGHTLARLGLDATPVDDTAGAAEILLNARLTDTAAIASCRAAEIYGLRVVARGIQDESWNTTRFLVLGRKSDLPPPPQDDDQRPLKTSIVVAHGGGLDVLFKVLSAFSKRKINLTKFEVKPPTAEPLRVLDVNGGGTVRQFEHVFYIDFEASVADDNAQSALQEVQEATTFVRVLGCYTADSKIYSLD